MFATSYAVWKTFEISAGTVADSLLGRLTVSRCDERLAGWSAGIVRRAGIDLTVTGQDAVPRGQAYVLMSNHQSHLDIPILYAAWPGRLRMVAKAELFRVPVFGAALHQAGFVRVERSGNRKQAVAAMHEASLAVTQGTTIWIAPEGTRSADGRLGTFKKGGFLLAQAAGAPIVPVAIDGSRHILPKHSRVFQTGVPVRVTFGAPIPVAGRPVEELIARLRTFLLAHVTDAGD